MDEWKKPSVETVAGDEYFHVKFSTDIFVMLMDIARGPSLFHYLLSCLLIGFMDPQTRSSHSHGRNPDLHK